MNTGDRQHPPGVMLMLQYWVLCGWTLACKGRRRHSP